MPDIRVLFIWEQLDIAARMAHHYARHVVHFQIFSEAPYCAGHLALVLLRLIDNAAAQHVPNVATVNTARLPKLKDLCYSITPSSVYGSAYFTGFELAYASANAFANDNAYFTFNPSGNRPLPVSTWPDNRRDIAVPDNVRDCYTTVQ